MFKSNTYLSKCINLAEISVTTWQHTIKWQIPEQAEHSTGQNLLKMLRVQGGITVLDGKLKHARSLHAMNKAGIMLVKQTHHNASKTHEVQPQLGVVMVFPQCCVLFA